MSWLDLAKMEAERATERVHESEVLWGLACEAYDKDPCRANQIARDATIQDGQGCEGPGSRVACQLNE